ncbi:MAG: response regulator [Elusimicrobia bacterium]|nr:response regulator [Elusimicrobiota bacterium]
MAMGNELDPDDANRKLAEKVSELERRLAEIEKRVKQPAAPQSCEPAEKAPPVSPARLADLRRIGGKDGLELLDAVIGLFLSSTTPLLAALHDAAAKRNANDLRSAAHALKSTSSNLGAREMMTLCQTLEKIAEIGAFSEAEKVLDALGAEFQRVHTTLEALREEGKAEPAAPPTSAEASTPRPLSVKASSKKAVICDDDKTLLHIVRHILEKQGFTVFDAVNGEEGLAFIRAQAPSFVLLDLDMPVKDGVQVLRELKDGGGASGYVMVLTHHESPLTHAECRSLGARQVMVKPFDAAAFAKSIDAMVQEGTI